MFAVVHWEAAHTDACFGLAASGPDSGCVFWEKGDPEHLEEEEEEEELNEEGWRFVMCHRD